MIRRKKWHSPARDQSASSSLHFPDPSILSFPIHFNFNPKNNSIFFIPCASPTQLLNLQLGIRYSVGKEASMVRALKPSDFDPKDKFWTRFPPEGSKITPPHQSTEFRWKDYCHVVFRHLRKLFQVDPADYMLAICGDDALRELSSPGKSGSIFCLTQDDRFMIKTVKKSEVNVRYMCTYGELCLVEFPVPLI